MLHNSDSANCSLFGASEQIMDQFRKTIEVWLDSIWTLLEDDPDGVMWYGPSDLFN